MTRTNEDYIRYGIAQLLLCGIDVYTRLGESKVCVVDDGTLKLCLLKRTYEDKRHAKLVLAEREHNVLVSATNRYNYICAVDVMGQRVWLLPTRDIPLAMTIRLSQKYDEYIVRYKREHRLAQVSLEAIMKRENMSKTVMNKHAEMTGTVESVDSKDILNLLDRKEKTDD